MPPSDDDEITATFYPVPATPPRLDLAQMTYMAGTLMAVFGYRFWPGRN